MSRISQVILATCLLFITGQVKCQEVIDIVRQENKIQEIRIRSDKASDVISISTKNKQSAILGSWTYQNGQKVFKPLVPLSAGKEYMVYRANQKSDSFNIKRIKLVPPQVLAFYPSADTVPENLLKCYLSFSQPMSETREIYRYISVVDEGGKLVKDVILPLKPALWNADQTILTLWIDPGRVKRELIRNKQMGIPLVKGSQYRIEVAKEWKGANGEFLSNGFVKNLYISDRDEEVPQANQWQLSPPAINSLSDLSIRFGESMDYATSLDGIAIYLNEKIIEGEISLKNNEKSWVFSPKNKWQKGHYRIIIDPSMEDIAGNNLLRPFDRDLYKQSDLTAVNPTELTFTVR